MVYYSVNKMVRLEIASYSIFENLFSVTSKNIYGCHRTDIIKEIITLEKQLKSNER
jgi:hypothetical protein